VTNDVDVVVVGAGPAGCAAAATVARGGGRVLLADRARFPRDKCCGDGLTTAATRHLDALGLDRADVASFRPAAEFAVRSPSGRTVRFPLGEGPGVYAAVARRNDLDAALVALARRRGVTVREGTRCTGVARGNGDVRVRFEGGEEIRARYVVAADGAWSPIRRMLAPPAPSAGPGRAADSRSDWIAFRTYATGVRPAALDRLWVWFDAALLPGYAWSFPLADGSVNLGIYVRRGAGARAAALWESTIAGPFAASLLGPDAVLSAPARAWPIPTRIERAGLAGLGGRVLFVGDAAGAADPLTGEGISQALETGILAAAAIAGAPSSPGAVADRYRAAVRRSLGRDQRVSLWCQVPLATPLGARAALRVVDASGFVRRNVGRWVFGDFPRAVAVMPRAWSSLVRRQPGPFAGSGDA